MAAPPGCARRPARPRAHLAPSSRRRRAYPQTPALRFAIDAPALNLTASLAADAILCGPSRRAAVRRGQLRSVAASCGPARWPRRQALPSGQRDTRLARLHEERQRLLEVELDRGRVVGLVADRQVLSQVELEIAATGGQQKRTGD